MRFVPVLLASQGISGSAGSEKGGFALTALTDSVPVSESPSAGVGTREFKAPKAVQLLLVIFKR